MLLGLMMIMMMRLLLLTTPTFLGKHPLGVNLNRKRYTKEAMSLGKQSKVLEYMKVILFIEMCVIRLV